MTRKLTAHSLLMTLGFLASSSAIVMSHHGTAGVYDYTHRITTKATVTKYVLCQSPCPDLFHLEERQRRRPDLGRRDSQSGKRAREWLDQEHIQGRGPTPGELRSGQGRQVFWELSSNRVRCRWQAVGWQGHLRRRGSGGCRRHEQLPVKPGYTKVEVKMPKDDGKRPASAAGEVRTTCECLIRKGVSTWRIVAWPCSLFWLLRL